MKRFAIIISLFCMLFACKKDQNPVPRSGDNFWIYNIKQDPEYTKLLAPFNALIYTGGYRQHGIIVYRIKLEEAVDDFVAYDRTCPYEASDCVMEWTLKDNYYCTCKCCKSKFNLLGGYMENGPAKYPLRKFNCEYIDGNLHIY